MEVLRGKTKLNILLMNLFILISLAVMILTTSILGFTASGLKLALIYSTTLLSTSLIMEGICDILVFKDYNYKNKLVITEGIFNICSGAIVAISSIMYLLFNASSIIDIKIIILIFMILYLLWNIALCVINFRRDNFTKIFYFIISILLSFGIVVLSMITSGMNGILPWLLSLGETLFIAVFLIFKVIAYLIKVPIHLESADLAEQVSRRDNIEQAQKNKRKEIKAALLELKQFFEQDLISDQEYETKKLELLNKFMEKK